MAEQSKRLYRSRTDRQLTGVLGGAAEYIGVDPSFMRIGYAVVTLFTMGFPGILLYALMAIVMPEAPEAGGEESTSGEDREVRGDG